MKQHCIRQSGYALYLRGIVPLRPPVAFNEAQLQHRFISLSGKPHLKLLLPVQFTTMLTMTTWTMAKNKWIKSDQSNKQWIVTMHRDQRALWGVEYHEVRTLQESSSPGCNTCFHSFPEAWTISPLPLRPRAGFFKLHAPWLSEYYHLWSNLTWHCVQQSSCPLKCKP